MASNCSGERLARSDDDMGLSRAWMKFMATYMPMMEPQGLKHWAMLSRRVEVSSEPIVRM